MAISNGYCTLAELKAYENISSTNANDDTVLEDLVEHASRTIDNLCGRRFYSATETHYFTPDYIDLLFVDDLLSVTTLKADEDGDGTYELTWATSDYSLEPRNALLSIPPAPYTMIRVKPNGLYSFPGVLNGIEIAGSWGYNTTSSHPDPIKTACLIIVSDAMLKREHKEQERGSLTSSGVVITAEGLPRRALDLIRPYRRLV